MNREQLIKHHEKLLNDYDAAEGDGLPSEHIYEQIALCEVLLINSTPFASDENLLGDA